MPEGLTGIYEKWRSRGELVKLPETVEAPLLVNVPPEYVASSIRVAYIGQETRGWDHGDVKTVRDFVSLPNAVTQLLQGYREFEFAKNYRGKRSPFWQFFRKLSHFLAVQPVWTDLVRFDVNYGDQGSRSLFRSDAELCAAILKAQHGLLADELRELAPHVCLFVTGPGYDSIIDREFQGVQRSALAGFSERQLARLSHHALPERTFRTYHPNYLRRSGLENAVFDALVRDLAEDFGVPPPSLK